MATDLDAAADFGVRDTEADGVTLSPDAAQITGAAIIVAPENTVELRGREGPIGQLIELIVGRATGTHSVLVGRAHGSRVWVLHGKGGTGKSAIAVEVATRATNSGVRTWYVHGRPETTLRNGLQTIALQAGAPQAALNNEHPADALWRHLNALKEPWLLVLDNIDDIASLETGDRPLSEGTGYLRRPSGYGFVLVTSRVGNPDDWGPWCHLEKVLSLDRKSGGQVLMDGISRGGLSDAKATDVGSEVAAQRLSDALGGLPLALRLAARVITSAHRGGIQVPAPRTFDEFRAVIERDDNSNGFDDDTVADFDRSTERTWNLALDLLEKQGNRFALPLLYLLASFGPAPIPYTLLLNDHILARSHLFRELTLRDLRAAIDGLQWMDLVETTTSETGGHSADLASLHPLVRRAHRVSHTVVRDVQAYRQLLADLLNHVCQQYPIKSPSSWWVWSLIAAHSSSPFELERSASIAGMTPYTVVSLTNPAHQAGRYYQRAGFYAEAERLFRTVFEIRQTVLAGRDRSTLDVRNDLAGVMQDRGRLTESIAEYREVLKIRTEDPGRDNPATLATRHSIAEALRDQGDYSAAEDEYREIVRLRVLNHGENHSDTLDSRQNLAFLLHLSGRYEESEQEYTRVLAAHHHESDPRRLSALHNFGRLQQDMGYYQRARDTFSEALRLRRASLPEAHRDTVTTEHALAYLAYLNGDFEAADDLYARVLKAQEGNHDLDPRGLPGTYHNVGLLRLAQGRLADSEQSLTMALQSRVGLLGEQHPDTLSTRRALADLARARGNLDAAEAALREILDIQCGRLGADHPDTVTTRHKLGLTLQAQHRFDEALEIFEAEVRARTMRVGEHHPETLAARSARAAVHHQLGQRREAAAEYQDILEIQLRCRDAAGPDVLATRARLAILFLVHRDYTAAEQQYREILSARQSISDGSDLQVARASTILELIAELRDADTSPASTAADGA